MLIISINYNYNNIYLYNRSGNCFIVLIIIIGLFIAPLVTIQLTGAMILLLMLLVIMYPLFIIIGSLLVLMTPLFIIALSPIAFILSFLGSNKTQNINIDNEINSENKDNELCNRLYLNKENVNNFESENYVNINDSIVSYNESNHLFYTCILCNKQTVTIQYKNSNHEMYYWCSFCQIVPNIKENNHFIDNKEKTIQYNQQQKCITDYNGYDTNIKSKNSEINYSDSIIYYKCKKCKRQTVTVQKKESDNTLYYWCAGCQIVDGIET